MGQRLAAVGLVDHRRKDHHAACSDIFTLLDIFDSSAGGHFCNTAQDRHAAGSYLDSMLDDGDFLLGAETLVFAEGAAHHETGDATLNQALEVYACRIEVKRLVFIQLGGGRREDAAPYDGSRHSSINLARRGFVNEHVYERHVQFNDSAAEAARCLYELVPVDVFFFQVLRVNPRLAIIFTGQDGQDFNVCCLCEHVVRSDALDGPANGL